MRLQLFTLACNLAGFLRTLALRDEVAQWSLTTLHDRLDQDRRPDPAPWPLHRVPARRVGVPTCDEAEQRVGWDRGESYMPKGDEQHRRQPESGHGLGTRGSSPAETYVDTPADHLRRLRL